MTMWNSNRGSSLKPVDLFFVAMLAVIAVAAGFLVFGYVTQSANVVTTIVGKDTQVTTTTYCSTPLPSSIASTQCTTESSKTYSVYSEGETFITSANIYHQLVAGKKYVFTVIGWPGFRVITRVVEGAE